MKTSTARSQARLVNDPRIAKIARDLAPELLAIQAERGRADASFDARERHALGKRLLAEYGSREQYEKHDPRKEVSLASLAAALQQTGIVTSEATLHRKITAYLVELDLAPSVSALKELSTTHLWLLSRVTEGRRRVQLATAAIRHGWTTRALEAAIEEHGRQGNQETPSKAAGGGARWSDARVRELLLVVIAPLRHALSTPAWKRVNLRASRALGVRPVRVTEGAGGRVLAEKLA